MYPTAPFMGQGSVVCRSAAHFQSTQLGWEMNGCCLRANASCSAAHHIRSGTCAGDIDRPRCLQTLGLHYGLICPNSSASSFTMWRSGQAHKTCRSFLVGFGGHYVALNVSNPRPSTRPCLIGDQHSLANAPLRRRNLRLGVVLDDDVRANRLCGGQSDKRSVRAAYGIQSHRL